MKSIMSGSVKALVQAQTQACEDCMTVFASVTFPSTEGLGFCMKVFGGGGLSFFYGSGSTYELKFTP